MPAAVLECAAMPGRPMLHYLGRACRITRGQKQRLQSHVAAVLNAHGETVARFERGETWGYNPDRMIAAYAIDLEVDPRDLWDLALQLWRADEPNVDLMQLLED